MVPEFSGFKTPYNGSMLFALKELRPYDWWGVVSDRLWMDRLHLQWVGEMEIFRHDGGARAYERYRKWMDRLW